MTDDRKERDDREPAEDLEPKDEAARDVTGGRDAGAVNMSDIKITKPTDKTSP